MSAAFHQLRARFASAEEMAQHLLEENAQLRRQVEQHEIHEQLLLAKQRIGAANGRNVCNGRPGARELRGIVRAAGQADRPR